MNVDDKRESDNNTINFRAWGRSDNKATLDGMLARPITRPKVIRPLSGYPHFPKLSTPITLNLPRGLTRATGSGIMIA